MHVKLEHHNNLALELYVKRNIIEYIDSLRQHSGPGKNLIRRFHYFHERCFSAPPAMIKE